MSVLEISRFLTMISAIWFFVAWLWLSWLIAIYASEKGRNGFGFFLLSLFFSPLAGVLVAILAGENKQKIESAMIYEGILKPCSYCLEPVKKTATKCRHCGSEI